MATRRWVWLLVGAALVLSLSCSLVTGTRRAGDESVAVTVEVQPEEPEETDDPELVELDEGTLRIDRDGLEELDSYRASVSWSMETDDGTAESFTMEQAAVRDPKARHFSMTSEDGSFEMIQIEDQVWMGFGDDWMQTSAGDDDMGGFGDFLTTSDDWVSDLEEGKYTYMGRETVSGFRTRHYRADNPGNWATLFGGDADSPDEVETAVADIWIADEAGLPAFIVRFTLVMTGTFDGERGSVTMQQEVTEVNQPITIEPPEGVASGGLPDGVLLYPGATDVTTLGGMTVFKTDESATLDDVYTFYEDALYAAGWEPTDEPFRFEGMVTSTWRSGDQQLTLTITSNDDVGGGNVIIMLEDVGE
jgi:hypothetical protein